jgi:hypothetical protein
MALCGTYTMSPDRRRISSDKLHEASRCFTFRISITQENGQWVLRPYHRYRNFRATINRIEQLLPWNIAAQLASQQLAA